MCQNAAHHTDNRYLALAAREENTVVGRSVHHGHEQDALGVVVEPGDPDGSQSRDQHIEEEGDALLG